MSQLGSAEGAQCATQGGAEDAEPAALSFDVALEARLLLRVVGLVDHDATVLSQEVELVRAGILNGAVIVTSTVGLSTAAPEHVGLSAIRVIHDLGRLTVDRSV